MKKFLLAMTVAVLAVSANSWAQPAIWSDNFETATTPALTAGWTQTSTNVPGWKTASGSGTIDWSAVFGASAGSYAVTGNSTKYAIVDAWKDSTVSKTDCNDMLKSPVINLSTASQGYLTFNYFFLGTYLSATGPTFAGSEHLEVFISDDGGTTWTMIDSVGSGSWSAHYTSLAGHTSATTKIGFRYYCQHHFCGAGLDNVKVMNAYTADLRMDSIKVGAYAPGTTNSYVASGGSAPMNGWIFNNSSNNVTSFTVSYKVNGGTTGSTTVTPTSAIKPFSFYEFRDVMVTMPSGSGPNATKTWVTIASDADHTNDTANATDLVAPFVPTKKIVVEEATGTWCGWCVRGIVYLDSMAKVHPGVMSLIAVHNSDPMVNTDYDSYISGLVGHSYPNMAIDRRQVVDPSDLFDIYDEEKNYFGYADVTLSSPTLIANVYTIHVDVKPAINLSGDYRLVLALTEDDLSGVDGSGLKWSQHNYYSGGGYGAMGGFESKPADVAGQVYDHVARVIAPSVSGNSSVLPASMTAGTTYNATLTTTLDWTKPYNTSKMHAIVMLRNNANGEILNSTEVSPLPTSIANVTAGIKGVQVFPNPATDQAFIKFNLENAGDVTLMVTNVVGQTVYTVNQHLSAGEQQMNLNTASFAAGSYNIKIQTENGGINQQLSVVK